MTKMISERVAKVAPSAVSNVLEAAHQLEADGADLVYLVRGEPDFDTPDHIIQAGIEALQAGYTHYGPVQGVPELRQAVADRVSRDTGLEVDPDSEVIITTGATMGIYLAAMAVINPGEEVLLFDPAYDPYPSVVRMAGGIPIKVPAKQRNGHFAVRREGIEAAVTERTKAILINNPWNPTGTVMRADELHALVDVAEAHDLILIVDEIYNKITFDNHIHYSLPALSPQARARTIAINSFSKTYAMTGWRLGYNIAPPNITKAMLNIGQQFSRSATTFVQFAGLAALNGSQAVVNRMTDAYAHRRKIAVEKLSQLGNRTFHPPEGTFFILLDIRSFGKDSERMSRYLLEHANVVTIPGSAYGSAGDQYIRLSFAYSEDTLIRGIDAIIKALEQL